MQNAELKLVRLDSGDVIATSTPVTPDQTYVNGEFTFKNFDNTKKFDGLIEGYWDGRLYSLYSGYYGPCQKDTQVKGNYGGKDDPSISWFFEKDAKEEPILDSNEVKFKFNGTFFIRQ